MEALRAQPRARRRYDTFMELQGVNLHDQARAAAPSSRPGCPRAKFGDAVGTTPIFLAQLRALLALLVGDLATARAELDELRRLCLGTLDPQWMEPLHAQEAQLALLEDRPTDARDAIRRGLGRWTTPQEGTADRPARWIGLMAEATAAERARALGEPASDGRARSGCSPRSSARGRCPADGPTRRPYAALARAEAGRLRHALGERGARPGRLGGARSTAFAGLEQPWHAAYAGFRAAEAHVQAGDRAAAVGRCAPRASAPRRWAPRRCWTRSTRWRGARGWRSPTPAARPPAAPDGRASPAAQLGLTPREHEVLLLVAAGAPTARSARSCS